jgi:hypothetical protein
VDQKSLPPIWVFIGAGVIVLAAFWFLLSSLVMGGASTAEATTPLPLATQPPVATEPVAQAPTAAALPTWTPQPELTSPIPTPVLPQVPPVAPDFTLEQASGGALTLSEQLAQGPVVLVLMQSGGG